MNDAGRVQNFSLETNSFDELCTSADGWDQEYCQMSPGTFEGGLDLTAVGSTQIMHERWGRKIHYQGTAPLGAYGFQMALSGAEPTTWNGHQANRDSVAIQLPGRAADFISGDIADMLVLGLSENDVEKLVSILTGGGEFATKYHEIAHLKPYNAEALRRLGKALLDLPDPTTSEDLDRYELYSEQFVKLFLWELVKARQDPELGADYTKPAIIVRDATDYILSNPIDKVGLTDICQQLNLSLRALHYAFSDVTGQSPANWLRRIRLNRVHKTLRNSAPDDLLIKQVAIDNGFLHMSHFTGQYQRLFGCLPSETLQSS